MEREVLKLAEWKEKGERLFGKDVKKWKFKCPKCGGVQTYQDFIDIGIKKPGDVFYFSCIGRWTENRGCNWTCGGLFQIHKVEVISEEGRNIPVFEFADNKEAK